MKKKTIVCIFAHPDDEAFGPSGTIAKWSKENNVYLICVTDGSNPNSGIKELNKIRKKELEASAKILGIKKVYFLKYCDGELNNNIYHKVSDDISKILHELKPSILLTYEMHGVSGHIDHIFVSMVSSYLFRKLKFIKKIYYFAEHKLISQLMKNYFVFFPEGYDESEVDQIEDVSEVNNIRISAAKAHLSQKKDMDMIIKKFKFLPARELFFVEDRSLKSRISEANFSAVNLTKALLQLGKKGRMI